MRLLIEDFSLQSAFNRLGEELESVDPEKWPQDVEKMVNLHDYDDLDVGELADKLEGSGILFGFTQENFGINSNKTQSGVKHVVHKGSKEWVTSYMAVWDSPKSIKIVPNTMFPTKGDSVTAAREATQKTGRDTFVIIGKYAKGFSRVQSEIIYKPSSDQLMGSYVFVW